MKAEKSACVSLRPLERLVRRLREWRHNRRVKKREAAVLRACGCWCKCPACGDILNDQASCRPEGDDGRYKYICGCGQVSDWHFGIAPAPILLSPNAAAQRQERSAAK